MDGFVPQAVDGAEFGWTANIPGFGLLADQFTEAALHVWTFDPASWHRRCSARKVRSKPFAEPLAMRPQHRACIRSSPRRVGGNMDIRDLSAGTTTLYLPVEVAGALFSVGDTHVRVMATASAIESRMDVVLTMDLVKNAPLKFPRFTTPDR